MASYIRSKVQQSLSFLLVLVIAFSVFSGVLFLNPSPSYAFNQGDLERLKKGDKNLSGADFSRADLTKAIFSGADLSGANLNATVLSGADFKGANLNKTKLIAANLNGANLNGANLNEAILYAANLTEADLTGANLTKAILTGAKLIGASADRNTKFPDGFDARSAGVKFRY